MNIPLKNIQKYCLDHNITFASYVSPGSGNPVSIFSPNSKVEIFKSISEVNCSSGFLMSPFQSENCPVIVIQDTQKITGWEIDPKIYSEITGYAESKARKISQQQKESTFSEYASQIEKLKKNLLKEEEKKVVLSRIKEFDAIETDHLPELFEELTISYPHAFVYLVSSPETGIWMGASPETLIQINQSDFSTMALAATKEFSGHMEQTKWNDKEVKEHEYVANFIRHRLSKENYTFTESKRETVRAGNVVHLMTLFNGRLKNKSAEWKSLVSLLYPTPAIFGTGDEATLKMIQEVEKHKREYYAGIIGPFKKNGETNLFINLRCMKVLGKSALLFAGGGILNESSALNEWEETELKFDTLIQVILKARGKVKKTG